MRQVDYSPSPGHPPHDQPAPFERVERHLLGRLDQTHLNRRAHRHKLEHVPTRHVLQPCLDQLADKLAAHNVSGDNSPSDRCVLSAGEDFDTLPFDVAGSIADDDESVALQVVHTFTIPGSVILSCTDTGNGDVVARFTKITAVQVANLHNDHI